MYKPKVALHLFQTKFKRVNSGFSLLSLTLGGKRKLIGCLTLESTLKELQLGLLLVCQSD